ncbi:LexA family transcriptional regulator [Paenibacillus dendritiformis]|nr:LexA family transcriptional regulator [Paenibacillus dendritiformis]
MKSAREILAENLQRLIDSKRIDQRVLAEHLGVSDSAVSQWLSGDKYPRIDKIQKIADFFNVPKSRLTEEQPSNLIHATPKTVRIPLLGVIACGVPILAEENVAEYIYESPDRLPSGNLFYLRAKGTSMEPTIPDGSLVLIREQPEVEPGEIAAVLVNGDTEATLKRIKRQGEIVILMPDNLEHEPIIITPDNPIRIIGRAIQFTQTL